MGGQRGQRNTSSVLFRSGSSGCGRSSVEATRQSLLPGGHRQSLLSRRQSKAAQSRRLSNMAWSCRSSALQSTASARSSHNLDEDRVAKLLLATMNEAFTARDDEAESSRTSDDEI